MKVSKLVNDDNYYAVRGIKTKARVVNNSSRPKGALERATRKRSRKSYLRPCDVLIPFVFQLTNVEKVL